MHIDLVLMCIGYINSARLELNIVLHGLFEYSHAAMFSFLYMQIQYCASKPSSASLLMVTHLPFIDLSKAPCSPKKLSSIFLANFIPHIFQRRCLKCVTYII
jgi:hypothetical protein